MGYLRRDKWIRDEMFVSGRGECVCVKLQQWSSRFMFSFFFFSGDGFRTNRPNLSVSKKLGQSWFTFPGTNLLNDTKIFHFVLYTQFRPQSIWDITWECGLPGG